MDAHTLELLEFNKVRDLLAGYAFSSLGKDLARQVEPGTEPAKIRAEVKLVTEMVGALEEGQTPPLAGLHDVRLLARRASLGSMLLADQLLLVADTLICTGHMYRFRMRLSDRYQGLIDLLTPVEDLGTVAKSITGCIDPRGHVLDMASPDLTRLRHELAQVDERVQGRIKKLLRDPELRKILRFPNATVSGDHYVLPVAINHRHKVPGLVHRTSGTGETVYIEPASVAGLSAERVLLKAEEEKEIRRILRRLSAEVGKVSRPLSFAIDCMARLDFITAKARFSRDYAMSPPDIVEDNRLWLRQARHPLLEYFVRSQESAVRDQESGVRSQESAKTIQQEQTSPPATDHRPLATGHSQLTTHHSPKEVVPIDIRLGNPFQLLIITGPNTGGKTVTLKTTGLLCLMAQAGMHIPAAHGSMVPVFHQVLADIGDEQSLEQSLSTFSSHMSRIAGIFQQVDSRTLVLLDELGAGTDPTEGAALGRAILDQLDRTGCLAMVTTHLGDLKTYAFTNDRAENAAVEFDADTLQPTYRLLIGQFGMSNALKIARRLELPPGLLKRARHYLRRRQRRAPEVALLQKKREDAEQARAEALRAQHEAEVQRQEFQEKTAALQREAEQAAALRQARANLQANDPVHVPRFDKVGRIVRVDHKRNLAVVSVGLGQWEVGLEEVFPVEKA